MKYKVEYWFRTQHDDMDSETVTVEANSEKEAIEKAKSEAIRGSRNFKIMKENNEFGRMKELAGISKDGGNINISSALESLNDVFDMLTDMDLRDLNEIERGQYKQLYQLCETFINECDPEV